MAGFDLKTLSQKWYNEERITLYQDTTDGRNPVNLDNVKISVVGEPTWTQISPSTSNSSQGPVRKVNVTKKKTGETKGETKSKNVYSDFETTKDSDMVVQVKVDKGVIRGLTRRLALPLPPELQKESLGDNVKIDPSVEQSTVKNSMKISVKTGCEIPDKEEASALIKCKEGEYEGRFKCTVALEGLVIFQSSKGPQQYEVSEIVVDREVEGAEKKGNRVHIEMEGSCVFNYDFEQTIEWQ